jgi:hypothetical protein
MGIFLHSIIHLHWLKHLDCTFPLPEKHNQESKKGTDGARIVGRWSKEVMNRKLIIFMNFFVFCLLLIVICTSCVPDPVVIPPESVSDTDIEEDEEAQSEDEIEDEGVEETFQYGVLNFNSETDSPYMLSWEIYINDVYFTTMEKNQEQSIELEIGEHELFIIRKILVPGFKLSTLNIQDTINLSTVGWTYYLQ